MGKNQRKDLFTRLVFVRIMWPKSNLEAFYRDGFWVDKDECEKQIFRLLVMCDYWSVKLTDYLCLLFVLPNFVNDD